MHKCAEELGLTLRWHDQVVSVVLRLPARSFLKRQVGTWPSWRSKAIRSLNVMLLIDYTVMLGERGPVPDRCAHQAGTSPLLLNTVGCFLL